jgi:hypothetical protein
MTTASERAFADAMEWARTECSRVQFGEVTLKLVMHDGRLARTERGITTKSLSDDGRENETRR